MKLHQLRYLAALSSEGSVRAAARALGVSQATVTQGLRELEQHAQVALFERAGGRIGFTPAGHELLQHAQRVVAELHNADQTLARHRAPASIERLSVGITPWVAQTLIPLLIPLFRRDMPHVQLELFDGLSALTYPKLREGSLDLMIGRIGPEPTMQGLQSQALFRYEMTVVARQDHPKAKAQSMAELVDCDWILNFAPGERQALMHNLFGQHGLSEPAHGIHLAQSASLMLTLVRQADMLTYCPWPLVETDSLRHSLIALSLRERFRPNTVGIVRRAQETPSPAAARFIALLLQLIRDSAASPQPELRRVFHSIDLLLDAGA